MSLGGRSGPRGNTAWEEPMSFLRSLFGLGAKEGGEPAVEAGREAEHKGFTILATPFKEGGQFQTSGVIRKEVEGALKEHRFIRADRFASLDEAVDFSLAKARQIIDEQGERILS
jgi:hypothetical protein